MVDVLSAVINKLVTYIYLGLSQKSLSFILDNWFSHKSMFWKPE